MAASLLILLGTYVQSCSFRLNSLRLIWPAIFSIYLAFAFLEDSTLSFSAFLSKFSNELLLMLPRMKFYPLVSYVNELSIASSDGNAAV